MKTIYLIVCLFVTVLFSQAVYAQTNFKFGYDANGNRESRIVLKSATIPTDSLSAKKTEQPIEDQIGLQQARIYPNPTKGLLKIDLPSLKEEIATIILFDLNGKEIIKKVATESSNTVDLSVYPPGLYVMRILVGLNSQKEWKIIKE